MSDEASQERQIQDLQDAAEVAQNATTLAQNATVFLQNIIDTGRVPFLVLDPDLRVVSANRVFYQTFQVTPEATVSSLVYDLGDGQWDIPALRRLLENILPGSTPFDDFEIEGDFPAIGRRTMLLNGRKVFRVGNNSRLILLSIEDMTVRRDLEHAREEAQRELQATHDALTQAHARLQADYEREKRITQALQRPLMLPVPENAFPGLSVATLYSAAWTDQSEVGGDFYDAVPLADKRVAFLVGDASGKGLAAAARATEVKDVLRAFLRVYPSYPALTLTRLNDYLCDVQSLDERSRDTFVALSLMVVNTKRSEALLAWAGIEPPILLRANGTVERVSGGGLPLGASEKAVYVDSTVRFGLGDALLLSTDGLTEARRGKDFLGNDGVEDLVRQAQTQPTVQGIAEAILEGARTFAEGKMTDDACLVLVRRR